MKAMFLSREHMRKTTKKWSRTSSSIKLVPIEQKQSTTIFEPVSKQVTKPVHLIDHFKDSDQNVQKIPSTSSVTTSTQSRASSVSVIDLLLTKVVCSDLKTSLYSLLQIEAILMSEDRLQLEDHVDYFILTLVNQLIVLEQCEDPLVMNCYYKIFVLFAKIYLYPELRCIISEGVIKRAIDQFVLLSIDEKMEIFLNCLDCLLCTVLELTEYSVTTCALLKSLFDTVQNSQTSRNFQDGIVKCLWKMITLFPSCDLDKIDYESIFSEIHAFLSSHPTVWWQKQPSNTPLTTVNTLLRILVELKPDHSKSCLEMVKGVTSESEISYYCNKITKFIDKGNLSDVQENDNTKSEFKDELSMIMEKIESPNESREGLHLLYEFKQRHPEENIDSFFNEMTQFFQSYVHRGLHSIELERHSIPDKSNYDYLPINDHPKICNSLDKIANTLEVQNLLERLHIIQEKAGWCTKLAEFQNELI